MDNAEFEMTRTEYVNVPTPGESIKVIELPKALPEEEHEPAIIYVLTELIRMSVVEKSILFAKLVVLAVVGAVFPTVRPIVDNK